MLKKSITFENFDGVSVTEDHYFNLTLAECTKLEAGDNLSTMLGNIVKSNDGKKILMAFEDIVSKAYGRREGDRFVKKPEYWEEFTQTEAWSSLFMEVATDAQKSVEFFQGMLPAKARQSFEEGFKGQKPNLVSVDEAQDKRSVLVSEHALDEADFNFDEYQKGRNEKRPEEMTDEELLRDLGVEIDYTKMSREEIRKLPRPQLIEAMKQRNQRPTR